MIDKQVKGLPFQSSAAAQVDDWSLAIYSALSDWPPAAKGKWTRWEPGYLLLEIEQVEDEAIDRIALWTRDDELTVYFGYFETNLPANPGDQVDAAATANEGKQLIEQWLSGEIKTAVFTDIEGKWCGTSLEGSTFEGALDAPSWISPSAVRVEVRTPLPADWRSYDVKPAEL